MMEILNTIWTALTTENELLTNFVIIPLYFIEAYVSMQLFSVVLNINATKKQKQIYILVVGCLAILIKLFFTIPYSTYLNIDEANELSNSNNRRDI